MKRTTYIFIGILVSVLVILMAGVVYISFQKSETNSYTLTLSENTEAEECIKYIGRGALLQRRSCTEKSSGSVRRENAGMSSEI